MKITKSQLKKLIKEELQNALNEEEALEEEIFAPSHYCVHHGGVQMEGKIKLGKVISHNWNEKLQKVTKYDMQFKDGTIVEGVDAADVLVTDASLAQEHMSHAAKRDDEEHLAEGIPRCKWQFPDCPNAGEADLGKHPKFGWLGEACVCDPGDPEQVRAARDKEIMRRTGGQKKDSTA